MRNFVVQTFQLAVYGVSLLLAATFIQHLDEVRLIEQAEAQYDSAEGRADATLKKALEKLSLGWYEGAQRQREARSALEAKRTHHLHLANRAAAQLGMLSGAFVLLQIIWAVLARQRSAYPGRLIFHLLAIAGISLAFTLVVPLYSLTVETEVRWLGKVVIQHQTHDLLGIAGNLIASGHSSVAGALVAFCIVLPSLKLGAGLLALMAVGGATTRLSRWLLLLGRLSLLDVVLIAGLVVYLAAGDSDYANAQIGPAAYFYAAYAGASVLSGILLAHFRSRMAGEAPASKA